MQLYIARAIIVHAAILSKSYQHSSWSPVARKRTLLVDMASIGAILLVDMASIGAILLVDMASIGAIFCYILWHFITALVLVELWCSSLWVLIKIMVRVRVRVRVRTGDRTKTGGRLVHFTVRRVP